jgi:DNA-binding XRE family transcriptional regulator
MVAQTILSPSGEEMVVISREEYEDLVDARRHEAAMRDVAAGRLETLSETDAVAYLAAKTPLAFWRRHRGMTQAALARAVGISQPYLAQMETGAREGQATLYRALGRVLRVRMEDLIAD